MLEPPQKCETNVTFMQMYPLKLSIDFKMVFFLLFHLPGKSRFLDFPQKGIYNIGDRAKNLLIFFGHFFSAKCTFDQVEREDEGETDLKSSHVCELTNFYLSPPSPSPYILHKHRVHLFLQRIFTLNLVHTLFCTHST